MISKIKFFFLFLFFSVFMFCSGEVRQRDFMAGSDLGRNGKITSADLNYVFNKTDKFETIRDFCNYAYFQGDTVCFSAKMNVPLNMENCKAYFLIDNVRHEAERVEFTGNRVYGFSLAGSILEFYYSENLNRNFESIRFPLEIKLKVLIAYDNGKIRKETENDLSATVDIK
ncbi:MAG: hypothetical protein JW982_07540 [Spirochaetes bacterium]|nr:hypothetical protein [Spirochaetota bacterium]